MKRVQIDLNAVGLGTITLDGHDVSAGVRGVTFRSEVGNLTEVTLDMVVRQRARASGEAQVIIPDDTARALHVLGWTSPDGAAPAYVHALLDAFLTGEPLDFAGAATVPPDVQARLREAWSARDEHE